MQTAQQEQMGDARYCGLVKHAHSPHLNAPTKERSVEEPMDAQKMETYVSLIQALMALLVWKVFHLLNKLSLPANFTFRI